MLNGIKPTINVGGNFSPIPEGAYICQIVDVNLVSGLNKFTGMDQDKLNYQFAILDDIKAEDGTSTRNRYLWQRCSLSMNEKSWLYKLATAVNGRTLSKEEMENFDPEALIGKTVKCLVGQKVSGDGSKVFNNILSFSKADKVLEAVEFSPKPSVVEKESKPISIPEEEISDPDQMIKNLEEKAKK